MLRNVNNNERKKFKISQRKGILGYNCKFFSLSFGQLYILENKDICLAFQDDGISDVHEMIVQEQPFPEKRMRGVFEELGSSCSKFVSIVKGTQASGKTKLDKERQKLLIREMVRVRL